MQTRSRLLDEVARLANGAAGVASGMREEIEALGAPLHDPCVTAYLLRPELFSGRHINVEIETGSELTMGMTVADWWRVTDRAPNATFMGDIDADGFFALLTERLARL